MNTFSIFLLVTGVLFIPNFIIRSHQKYFSKLPTRKHFISVVLISFIFVISFTGCGRASDNNEEIKETINAMDKNADEASPSPSPQQTATPPSRPTATPCATATSKPTETPKPTDIPSQSPVPTIEPILPPTEAPILPTAVPALPTEVPQLPPSEESSAQSNEAPISQSAPAPDTLSSVESSNQKSASGENNISSDNNTALQNDGSVMVWIDDTAKRYHKKNGCGMDNAYQVTLEEAIQKGKTPCGRCYK